MLEIADRRDIENEAAAATVTAEENNEQPASDSDTSSSIDSDCNTIWLACCAVTEQVPLSEPFSHCDTTVIMAVIVCCTRMPDRSTFDEDAGLQCTA